MFQSRGRKREIAAGLMLLVAVTFSTSITTVRADEPAADKPAEAKPKPPGGGGLVPFFQNFMQRMFMPPGREAPRVRAGNEAMAERANGARDAIDARAPRNPKLDGLWTASNTAIRNADWKHAVELLQRLLDSPEDAVYRAKEGRWESLRTAASGQLGQAPAEVLIDYERQYGGLAEQLWTEARQSGRIDTIVEVATRFLHTAAGKKAANYLAHWHFDRAEFALSVRWFLELDAVHAVESRDLRWRMKAAYAARQASPDQVRHFLDPALRDPRAEATNLGGTTISVADAWTRLPGQSPQKTPVLNRWPQLFGTSARVGIATGNPPLLKPEWSASLTSSAMLRRRLNWILQDLEDQQQTPIMVGMPLVLGDKVAFRDLRGVRMVDAATGRTLWATTEGLSAERILSGIRSDEMDDADFPNATGIGLNSDDEYTGPSAEFHPLVSHLFRDATIGLISSDTRNLYALEDVATLTRSQQGHQWDGEGEPVDPYGANWHSNRLTAYSVETGRRLWSVGGGEGRDPQDALSGCFFLGAPVADGDELLIVGSLGEEIRLLALDPASGTLQWSQLLAYADTKIDLDIARRWVSTPVATGQGIVICPTTVGWLVAVDRTRRTVLWAHRYIPEDDEHDVSGDGGTMFQSPRELNGQWLAAPPVMAGSKVVFTPSDGDVMVCLDLTQGRLQWQEDREDGMYLAGVVGELVITVGHASVTARNLDDGKEKWAYEWETGVAPNGRGAIVGDQLYLPMNDGTLRLIALETGKQTEKLAVWPGEPSLGSLVKADRRLFAYGPRGLQMFDEQPGVLAEIQQRKAANPHDAEALIREAELWMLTPRYDDAAKQLLTIRETDLSPLLKRRHRTVLWQALVGVIQTDTSHADAALKEIARLAVTPDEKLSVELFRIDREVTAGHSRAAFEAYWQLAEQDQGPATITRPHQPQLETQRRVWLRGKLGDVWQSSTGELREQLNSQVERAVTEAINGPLDRLVKLADWCDFHPAAARLHWKLSDEFAAVRNFGSAEQQLLPWADHATVAIAAETHWRLALLYRQFGLFEDALLVERMLWTRYGDVTLSTGQTLAAALASRPADAATVTPVAPSLWDHAVLVTQQVGTQYSPPVQEVVSPIDSPFLSQLLMQIEPHEQRLTLTDRRDGRWRWLAPLRGSPRGQDYGESPTSVLGHTVIVLHKDVLQRLSPVERRLMWSKTLNENQTGGAGHHNSHRQVPQPLQMPSADEFDHEALFEQSPMGGQLAAVFPNYLCLQGRRSLTVYDPHTGQESWTRTGISPHALIYPGRDWLCVVEMEDDKVSVYRTCDGQPVEAPDLITRLRKSLRLLGNDLIQLESQAGLRLFNLGSGRTVLRRTELLSGRELWKQDFSTKTHVGMVDDHYAIAVDASTGGKAAKRSVALIRLRDGERQTFAPITFPSADGEFFPLLDADCLYLVANHSDGNTYHYGDSLTTLPVNGTVCCWDRVTGELLWSREITDQNLVLERFAPSPVLLFLTRSWKQNGNASYTLLNMLAVGKRSGETLHESSIPSMFGGFHSLTLREHESTIELASYNLKMRLVPRRENPPVESK